MKKLTTLLLGILAAVAALQAQNVFWFDKPASYWEEALPIGNGRIGAMIFGGTDTEEIQLNEETISTGGPYENWNPNGLKNLQKIRELIFAGEYEAAQKLGVNPYFLKEYDTAVRNYPLERCRRVISLLTEYDYKGKGGEAGEATPAALLTELVTKILNF